MQILQDIYDRQHVADVAVAKDWIAEKITVRESYHVPYRYVMAVSRVKPGEHAGDEKANEDTYCDVFVELLLSGVSFSKCSKIIQFFDGKFQN